MNKYESLARELYNGLSLKYKDSLNNYNGNISINDVYNLLNSKFKKLRDIQPDYTLCNQVNYQNINLERNTNIKKIRMGTLDTKCQNIYEKIDKEKLEIVFDFINMKFDEEYSVTISKNIDSNKIDIQDPRALQLFQKHYLKIIETFNILDEFSLILNSSPYVVYSDELFDISLNCDVRGNVYTNIELQENKKDMFLSMGYDIYKLNQEIQKLAPNILKIIPVLISELEPIIGATVKDILSSGFELIKKGTNVYSVINCCDENSNKIDKIKIKIL